MTNAHRRALALAERMPGGLRLTGRARQPSDPAGIFTRPRKRRPAPIPGRTSPSAPRSKRSTNTTGTTRSAASTCCAPTTPARTSWAFSRSPSFRLAPDVPNDRRYGLRVDFQYGQATETVQGGAANEPRPDVYRHIWQAYGSTSSPSATACRPTSASSPRTSGSRPTTRRTTTTSRARTCSTSCRSITRACG